MKHYEATTIHLQFPKYIEPQEKTIGFENDMYFHILFNYLHLKTGRFKKRNGLNFCKITLISGSKEVYRDE